MIDERVLNQIVPGISADDPYVVALFIQTDQFAPIEPDFEWLGGLFAGLGQLQLRNRMNNPEAVEAILASQLFAWVDAKLADRAMCFALGVLAAGLEGYSVIKPRIQAYAQCMTVRDAAFP